MNIYLLVLGTHPELSRAELRTRADEVFYDAEKNLLLAENLQFKNPRNLPRGEEQLFLDQLGGVVRMARVIGEYFDRSKLEQAIWSEIESAEKFKCGFSVFGGGKRLLGDLIYRTKDHFEKIRIENYKGENLSSGQIFQRRILQKGHEFIVWQRGNSYLLCETVANQNLRNYELRDRKKDFRDAKMGMLPPKLAQILLNLSTAGQAQSVVVLDPFCGSGTVNIEAAISGFTTKGSDLNNHFVSQAELNFKQMAEKFRYEDGSGKFRQKDAKFCMDEIKAETVIATEGWLGENFTSKPSKDEVQKNAGAVYDLWRQVLRHTSENQVQQLALCLPAWNHAGRKTSISSKLINFAVTLGYEPVVFQDESNTQFYEREGAYVAREVVVLKQR